MLAPVLVDAGQPSWARELLDDGIRARPAECRAPRLFAQRAWLRRNDGDDPGALEDLAASSKREARACVQATDTAVIGAAHASTPSKPSDNEAA